VERGRFCNGALADTNRQHHKKHKQRRTYGVDFHGSSPLRAQGAFVETREKIPYLIELKDFVAYTKWRRVQSCTPLPHPAKPACKLVRNADCL
jgi:hypothetical protein